MEIKERIVSASLLLFIQRGVRAITMDDIAREVGMSKRTLYEHFSDKKALLMEAMVYLHKQHRLKAETLISSSSNKLEAMIRAMIGMIENYQEVHPSFYKDMRRYYPQIDGYMREKAAENADRMILHLADAMQQGYVRKQVNLDIIKLMLLNNSNYLVYADMDVKLRQRGKELTETLLVIFFRGISTPKGLEMMDAIQKQHKS